MLACSSRAEPRCPQPNSCGRAARGCTPSEVPDFDTEVGQYPRPWVTSAPRVATQSEQAAGKKTMKGTEAATTKPGDAGTEEGWHGRAAARFWWRSGQSRVKRRPEWRTPVYRPGAEGEPRESHDSPRLGRAVRHGKRELVNLAEVELAGLAQADAAGVPWTPGRRIPAVTLQE